MATKPILNLPEWASTEPIGANVIEPTQRKTTGYTKNLQGIPEKPTYQELNFLLKSNYEWTQYLENVTDEINLITVTAGEALSANDVIRLSGGMAYKAYSTREIGLYGVVGFVTQATAINDVAIIAVRYWNGFSGLSAGNDYYIDTNGTIGTQGVFQLYPKYFKIGTAINSTTILINFEERSEFRQHFNMIKEITANTPTQMFQCQINDTGLTEGILKIKSVAVSGAGFADGVEKAIVWRGYDADFQVRDNIDIIPEDPTSINTITYSISGGIITFSLEVSYTVYMMIVCENTSKVEMIFTEL